MQQIDSYNFKNKRALVRVDFNVPLAKDGTISDDTRIKAVLPTLSKVLEGGGSAIVLSHMGRPKEFTPKLSLSVVTPLLESYLGVKVLFAPDAMGKEAQSLSASLKEGELLLLENLRFHKEEEGKECTPQNIERFTKQLASYGECYINDAFGTAHRAHSSTALIAKYFPQDKMFGTLMEQEIEALERVVKSPNRPVTAIVGGAKISTKIKVIQNLFNFCNHIIVGGAMSYTFIKAQGGKVGESLYEEEYLSLALQILERAKKEGVKLHFAKESVVAQRVENDTPSKICNSFEIEQGWMGVDVAPSAIEEWKAVLEGSKTVLWNGPVGIFEIPNFAHGTNAIAQILAEITQQGAYTLVGGGDSVAAIKQMGFGDKVSYISTGGGAMLEYLEGRVLPGIEAITSNS
ncbi:MAG: phosphoglycerate kinase [Bacteroidales bacterium]